MEVKEKHVNRLLKLTEFPEDKHLDLVETGETLIPTITVELQVRAMAIMSEGWSASSC